MTTLPEEAVTAATAIIRAHDNEAWGEDCGDEPYADLVTRMLTAALPFLPVQGAVKEVIADYVEKFPLAKLVGDWPYEHDADAAFDTGARAQRLTVAQAIRDMELTISEPSAARKLALEEAAQAVEALKGRSRSPQVLQGFGDARREAAAAIRALSSPDHADAGKVETSAARDVLAERRRQIEEEGWTAKRDDKYKAGELAKAAACYAYGYRLAATYWPWDLSWWKPSNRRRDLVKAGALIIAEIERLDRLSAPSEGAE